MINTEIQSNSRNDQNEYCWKLEKPKKHTQNGKAATPVTQFCLSLTRQNPSSTEYYPLEKAKLFILSSSTVHANHKNPESKLQKIKTVRSNEVLPSKQ